ncbi:MAG: hypothetical protein MI700_14645, partial [Balneolales bacterium]|nr:hypothetical protein [Balneolales bacterium]
MGKTKKIRGHKRIWKRIEDWRKNSLSLDVEAFKKTHREWTKVYVRPYFSLDNGTTKTPAPKAQTRTLIIEALFDIFDSWKTQMDKLGKPYYLKIWFYQHNVAKSQVVCAYESQLNNYDDVFFTPEEQKTVDYDTFGPHKNRAQQLNWEYRIDEISIYDDFLGDQDQWANQDEYINARRWFKRKLK